MGRFPQNSDDMHGQGLRYTMAASLLRAAPVVGVTQRAPSGASLH